jgi:hypothetical protein
MFWDIPWWVWTILGAVIAIAIIVGLLAAYWPQALMA